jgi:hypothetical protein
MPKVMRASQAQLSQQVVLPGRVAGGPPARLVLSGQPDGAQVVERDQDGRRPWGAPAQALTDLLDRLRSAIAQRGQHPSRRVWQEATGSATRTRACL